MAIESDKLRERLDRATAHLDPPYAVVDLTAFDANSAALADRDGIKSPGGVVVTLDRTREALSVELGTARDEGWTGAPDSMPEPRPVAPMVQRRMRFRTQRSRFALPEGG